MFFDQTFTLYHDSGKVEIIDNLLEYIAEHDGIDRFHSKMKFDLAEFNKKNRETFWKNRFYYEMYPEKFVGYYLCTEKGLLVSPDLLMGEYMILYNEYREHKRNARDTEWRHKRSYMYKHNHSRYKRPKTQQERRMACAVLKDEGEPDIRGRRKMRSLPSYWDDIRTRHSTGWKYSTKRKHQYKGS